MQSHTGLHGSRVRTPGPWLLLAGQHGNKRRVSLGKELWWRLFLNYWWTIIWRANLCQTERSRFRMLDQVGGMGFQKPKLKNSLLLWKSEANMGQSRAQNLRNPELAILTLNVFINNYSLLCNTGISIFKTMDGCQFHCKLEVVRTYKLIFRNCKILTYFGWKHLNHALLVKFASISDITICWNCKCEVCLHYSLELVTEKW